MAHSSTLEAQVLNVLHNTFRYKLVAFEVAMYTHIRCEYTSQLVHIYNWYLRRVQCRCGLSKRDDAACFQETGARVYMIRC